MRERKIKYYKEISNFLKRIQIEQRINKEIENKIPSYTKSKNKVKVKSLYK